jgi:hypothetical protein
MAVPGTSHKEICLAEKLKIFLSTVGAEVVVQEDFRRYGGTLLEKLEQYIASCDRVNALVGSAYVRNWTRADRRKASI